MTEEEYFRKNYPDSCYGDKPLSPHWDYFQYGVEFGERESEKKIADLEKENADLQKSYEELYNSMRVIKDQRNVLEKENAELKKVAEFQQSSNMSRHFENKKLKEGLAVGSTFNKALNSMNKNLEEERDKYRNMVFDKDDQVTKAKELLKQWLSLFGFKVEKLSKDTEQFLKEINE